MRKEEKQTGDLFNVLLAMYNEQCTQARHYESQRATVSGFLIAISAAMIGLITYDQHITLWDIPAVIFLIVLWLFGLVSSIRHYERSLLHGKRAEAYRNKLDVLIPGADIRKTRENADENTKSGFSKWHRVPPRELHQIWHVLHLVITALGILSLLLVFLIGAC